MLDLEVVDGGTELEFVVELGGGKVVEF